MVKECAIELSCDLALLINKSVLSGQFPEQLKLSKITPIFKKGNKLAIENYRGIASLPCFSKIVESAVHRRHENFIQKYIIVNGSQHGFRRLRSTESATSELIQTTYDSLDDGNIVVAIFIDLYPGFSTCLIVAYCLENLMRMAFEAI
nr:unnamed protein product [Callosobruchus analis]